MGFELRVLEFRAWGVRIWELEAVAATSSPLVLLSGIALCVQSKSGEP